MRIVTLVRLIFNVRGVDCDTTRSFFGSLIDFVVSHLFRTAASSHHHRDSSRQSGLAVVNVADGTDVNVGFASVEFSLSHN